MQSSHCHPERGRDFGGFVWTLGATLIVLSGCARVSRPLADDGSVRDTSDAPLEVTVGRAHTCSLRESGRVECWGANDRRQIGASDARDHERASVVSFDGALRVDAGDEHTCALSGEGEVFCWGANDVGQLGDGTTHDRSSPAGVLLPERAVEMAIGGRSSCARESDGDVVCWGAGPVGGALEARVVMGIEDAIDIDVGGAHGCAVRRDGRVVCWGANEHGQLGDGTRLSRAHGALVLELFNIISVLTGDAHTCAIDDELHAICWGANDSSQLGDGTTVDRLRPSVRHHSVIATGGNRTCGRFAFGQVACWGEGFGRNPVLIENLEEAGRIAIGSSHGCAVHLVGVPRCWGENSRGQLGDGTWTSSMVPVDALAPSE